MKRTILLLVVMLLACSITKAQYRVNKKQYNPKSYVYKVGDPYNPFASGLVSFFVPGLGQMLTGERERGVCFLTGYVGFTTIGCVGIFQYLDDNLFENEVLDPSGEIFMRIGFGGVMLLKVWSAFDAVRVAKVNNLAFRAQNKIVGRINIEPYLVSTSTHTAKASLSPGLSFKMKF